MTTGRGDRVTRGDDAGTVDPSGIDRLAESDVEQIAAGLDEQPQISDRCEARTQRAAGIAHRTQQTGEEIVKEINNITDFENYFEKVEFVKPGFINIVISKKFVNYNLRKMQLDKINK